MLNFNDQDLREWISKNTILFLLLASLYANVYQYQKHEGLLKEIIEEKAKRIEDKEATIKHEQSQKELLESILKEFQNKNEKTNDVNNDKR